jgi:hypothetical protein
VTIRPGADDDVEVSGLPHGLGWDVVPARKETARAVEN